MGFATEFTYTTKLLNSLERLNVGQGCSAQGYRNVDTEPSVFGDVYSRESVLKRSPDRFTPIAQEHRKICIVKTNILILPQTHYHPQHL